MTRTRPNILISGTPGTGKSSLASLLAQKSDFTHIPVGDFAKENDCLDEWDPDYQSHGINEDKLLDLLEERQAPGGLIVEHHVTDMFPERWFDVVFVLRTDNTLLYDRLAARGYHAKKLHENVQCEIFQTILEEARSSYRPDIVHELQSDTVDQQLQNSDQIIAWIDRWHEDRGKARPTKRKSTHTSSAAD